MGFNASPKAMVVWQKFTSAILALIAKTKFDIMTAFFYSKIRRTSLKKFECHLV